MEIRIASLIEGARNAEGTVIVLDVFRAFTTAPIAITRGANKIILVGEIDEALSLKKEGLGDICIGEVGGQKPIGFDYGNSPFELSQADINGKTLIQSTRAGTVGVNTVTKAGKIYIGSLVIAQATVNAILRTPPKLVTIVAMGVEGKERSDEDEQCALYMRNLLRGETPSHEAVSALILCGEESKKYDDPEQPQFHPKDRDIALKIDSIPFAITVSKENGLLVARRNKY